MRIVLALLAALWLGAPTAHAQSRSRPQSGTVTVYAAASLKDALDEMDAAFQRHRGAARITASFAASSVLARQIEQGAPAEVFISADADWMTYLAKRGLIRAETRSDLLSNRLALIAPSGSHIGLRMGRRMPLAQALGGGRLALSGPDVPAGRYGKAALSALGVWDSVASRTVLGENVRATLKFVSLGEAPLGVVYDTDARLDRGVKIVGLFPEDSHPKIVYPAAATTRGRSPQVSAYMAFLRGAEASAIFRKYGFKTLAR